MKNVRLWMVLGLLVTAWVLHGQVVVGSHLADSPPWISFAPTVRLVTSTNGGLDAAGKRPALGDIEILVDGDGSRSQHWWTISSTNTSSGGGGGGVSFSSNVVINGFSITGAGTLSASNLIALNYISTTGTVFAGSLVMTSIYGAVTNTVGPDGWNQNGSAVVLQNTFALAMNNYTRVTNKVVVSTNLFVCDVGSTNGRPVQALLLATNCSITFTNFLAGMSGQFFLYHTNAARTVTWPNGTLMSGLVTTNVSKMNVVAWTAETDTNMLINISLDK